MKKVKKAPEKKKPVKKVAPKKAKKAPPKRRVRRNAYGRALEKAQNDLTRASEAYRRCEEKMASLESDIPKLISVVQSLGGYFEKTPEMVAIEALKASRALKSPREEDGTYTQLQNFNPSESHEVRPSNPLPTNPADLVPEHLRKFIRPHVSTTKISLARGNATGGPSSLDEDAFLSDRLPGTEILP